MRSTRGSVKRRSASIVEMSRRGRLSVAVTYIVVYVRRMRRMRRMRTMEFFCQLGLTSEVLKLQNHQLSLIASRIHNISTRSLYEWIAIILIVYEC